MSNPTIEEIFTFTNPLFWLWALILFLVHLFRKLVDASGLYDWYFVLMQKKGRNKEAEKTIKRIAENNNFGWLKRKAWIYAAKQY